MTIFYGAPGNLDLEAFPTFDPTPRVRATITGLGVVSVVVKLTRTYAGVTETVPGARAWDVVDSGIVTDVAAPLNRQATYTLWVDGVIADVKTITLASEFAVLQDPLQPDRALPVSMTRVAGAVYLRDEALKDVSYPLRGSSMDIMGDPVPVGFGAQRMGLAGINAAMSSREVPVTDAFRLLISEAPILLLRTTADMVPLPPLSYLMADVSEQPVNIHIGGDVTRWQVTGSLVRAVLQSPISGFITYDMVDALLAPYTYDEVEAVCAATTYLDWQKNPLIFSTL